MYLIALLMTSPTKWLNVTPENGHHVTGYRARSLTNYSVGTESYRWTARGDQPEKPLMCSVNYITILKGVVQHHSCPHGLCLVFQNSPNQVNVSEVQCHFQPLDKSGVVS